MNAPVHVWDLPLRLFHWALVLLITAAWITAEQRWLAWHRPIGYTLFALVLFRLLWGFAGSTTARFANFVRGPRAVWKYLREELLGRDAPPRIGHNPLGGWNVVAMLALLCVQIGLGLFAVDIDGIESGPLAHLVSFDAGRRAARWHEWIFNGLLMLIGLHLAALLYYELCKRERLSAAMFSGRRTVPATNRPPLYRAPAWLAGILLALSAGAVAALIVGFG